jgi:hypothetical protein
VDNVFANLMSDFDAPKQLGATTISGILSLEDCIEELIQEEIYDESDLSHDVRFSRNKRVDLGMYTTPRDIKTGESSRADRLADVSAADAHDPAGMADAVQAIFSSNQELGVKRAVNVFKKLAAKAKARKAFKARVLGTPSGQEQLERLKREASSSSSIDRLLSTQHLGGRCVYVNVCACVCVCECVLGRGVTCERTASSMHVCHSYTNTTTLAHARSPSTERKASIIFRYVCVCVCVCGWMCRVGGHRAGAHHDSLLRTHSRSYSHGTPTFGPRPSPLRLSNHVVPVVTGSPGQAGLTGECVCGWRRV